MKRWLLFVLFACTVHAEIFYNPDYPATKLPQKSPNESIPTQQSSRSCVASLTINPYSTTSSIVEVDKEVVRSALRYQYDPEYRAAVEREIEHNFSCICACNDPLIHRQAQARLALLTASAEPLYQAAFEDVQRKLIAK